MGIALTTATTATDTALVTAKAYTDTALVTAKAYSDENDTSTLASANAYTDTKYDTLNLLVLSLQSQLNGLWSDHSYLITPPWANSAQATDLTDLVRNVSFIGAGIGNAEHIAIDVGGTVQCRAYLLTMPDRGFDVTPLFASEYSNPTASD